MSCNDCFFRQEGLCALPTNSPCPTFRHAKVGALVPPPQPRLIAVEGQGAMALSPAAAA